MRAATRFRNAAGSSGRHAASRAGAGRGTEPLDRTDSVARIPLQAEQRRKLRRAFLLPSHNLSFLAGSPIVRDDLGLFDEREKKVFAGGWTRSSPIGPLSLTSQGAPHPRPPGPLFIRTRLLLACLLNLCADLFDQLLTDLVLELLVDWLHCILEELQLGRRELRDRHAGLAQPGDLRL